MADQALANAEARLASLRTESTNLAKKINELAASWEKKQEEIGTVEGFIKMWHQMAGTEPAPSAEQKASTPPVDAARRIRPANPPRQFVADRCAYYIRKAGRPLMRKELMEMLAADDIVIRGKDPLMVLSTMLWRSDETIIRLPGGGYWPAGEPTPTERSLEELMNG